MQALIYNKSYKLCLPSVLRKYQNWIDPHFSNQYQLKDQRHLHQVTAAQYITQ